MSEPLMIVGAGGHARVVLGSLSTERMSGWVTPDHDIGTTLLGHPVLGGDEVLAQRTEPAHVAIGDNGRRRKVVGCVGPRVWATVASPHALVLGSVEIGDGAFLGARTLVQPGVRIGRHAILNSGALVEHDCTIGDFAHVAPGAILAGGASVGDGALVGIGAVVRQGIVIGRDAVVGAGAVVVRDVPDGATVVGNPARPLER